MKIFIIANGYPSKKYLINGIFEFDQASALAARGHEIVYLAIDLRSIRRWRVWTEKSLVMNAVNIEVINIPLGKVPKSIYQFFGVLGLYIVFQRCIRKYGIPDVIHAHFTYPGFFAVKALKKKKIPIVVTEHSSAINKEKINPPYKKMAEYVYSNVKNIITVSPTLQKRLTSIFQVESTFIPNIVDLNVFSYTTDVKNNEIFRLVSVGSLIPLKRMNRLISGFSLFAKEHPNCELIIFGEGPDRKKLQKQLTELDLDDKVFIKGNCSRKQIAEAYKDTHCFILVSSSETFGVAYIEALASGVPVIATTCGGPEVFVHKNNGILIPVDDEKALLQALITMYNTYSNYNYESIATEIAMKFSPNNIAYQLELYYQRLLD